MTTTLNLAEHLLAMGRKYQFLGRDHDALQFLNRVISLHELPPQISEEAKQRLAEILLNHGRCLSARRHLTALLVQRPDSARYHYLMASALNGDEKSDPRRAAEHYRKSLELDPNQTKCLGELGLLLLRLGQSAEALQHLRRAVELLPNDPEVVGLLVEGLRQEGETDEARKQLLAARFRNPHDPRFRKLWNDFHFHLLRAEQQSGQDDGVIELNSGPRLLPFVSKPRTPAVTEGVATIIRHDAPSAPQPPHSPRPSRLPGKKHA